MLLLQAWSEGFEQTGDYRSAQEQVLLHQKDLEELKKRHTLEALNTLITSQEDERLRIAQDLHDGLGGLLVNLRIRVYQMMQLQDDNEVVSEMRVYLGMLDAIGTEIRRIAHNMMPHALIRMGLVPALEDLAATVQSLGQMDVSFQSINCEEPLGKDKEITLYRIAQELCANAVQHSHADNLLIQLSRHNGTASMVVEDNGVGFEQNGKSKGMGLGSIASRVTFLGGDLEVISQLGVGTSVNIHFPVS